MQTVLAEVITIGDELLIGQVVDTNSAWIGEQLSGAGIRVKQITSVSDDKAHILAALAEAKNRVDIILITGGLGPTKDDITKHTLCEYFNTTLIPHPEIEEHIRHLFLSRFKREPSEVNLRQADLPANCTPLKNNVGTAAGMWFEQDGKIFISMPGVPYEMKDIVENEALPRLKARFELPVIIHKTFLTQGYGESMIAEMIEAWEDALPKHMKLAYLPSPGAVRLRISAIGDNADALQQEVEAQGVQLEALLGTKIYGYGKETLESVIGGMLRQRKATLSIAESCTGGNISHHITLVPGSSDYFVGSVVSYDNAVKINQLGVNASDLAFGGAGAVSETVAIQMAEGVKKLLGTDYAISVTGIAGPTSDNTSKPVGLVWIAVAGPEGTKAKEFMLKDIRERFISRATLTALNMLRYYLLADS
jgi:nicotinamide-nucleotide amidase